MNKHYIKPSLYQRTLEEESLNHFVDLDLWVASYDRAVIYPAVYGKGGGVVDSEGDFVYGSSVYNEQTSEEGPYESLIEDDDSEVVYLGAFYSCWGHCITDCLRRLWLLASSSVGDEIKRLKFVYVTSSQGPDLPENFWRIVNRLGFDKSQMVEIKTPTRFRRVLIPDSCFHNNRQLGRMEYTREFEAMIDRIISVSTRGLSHKAYRKVFFSRAQWGTDNEWQKQRELGIGYIESAFRAKGFEIIYPERLTLDEMILLLQECSDFASTDGSCAHNAIFLQKGARSIVVRKADYINQYQPLINQMRCLDAEYIDANLSNMLEDPKYPMIGPFFLYVNKRMAAFSGQRKAFPLRMYSQYAARRLKVILGRRLRWLVILKNMIRDRK